MCAVKDLMTKDPKTCNIQDSILSALNIMEQENVGSVPVVDNSGRLQSILTDRDIALAVRKHCNELPNDLLIKDCLQHDHYIVTVNPEDSIENAMALMEENQVRRLPVRDENMRCIGIVSQADIARYNPADKKTARLVQSISKAS